MWLQQSSSIGFALTALGIFRRSSRGTALRSAINADIASFSHLSDSGS